MNQTDAQIYLADQRGCSQMDWFRSFHTFIFGAYFHENKKPFGTLQLLNDETLAAGKSIKMQVESDTEVLILPLVGGLEYKNSMGEQGFLETGQALTFILEKGMNYEIINPYETELINFLQIWIKHNNISSFISKNEIISYTNCQPEKIIVIENPIQEQYLESEKKEFNKECPTVLQVGTLPNKNVVNLIKAINGINCKLKLIGELDANLFSELKENNIKFENASGLSDAEIKDEYKKADIVAFCSTYEGFGLPIIEAQAMHKPIITSTLQPMKEVSGGAAQLVNPYDCESIRQGILNIINSETLRNELISQGLENIKRFDPKFITGRYEKLYTNVLDEVAKTNENNSI